MRVCFVCGRKSPDGTLTCPSCRWPLSSKGYWAYRLSQAALTLVLVPLLLWAISALWDVAQQRQVAREELEKAKTQLLDSITSRMEGFITLRSDLWKARTTFTRGCLTRSADNDRPANTITSCQGLYDSAIEALDQAVVDLSWRIDSLPILSHDTYAVLTELKESYWRACADNQPPDACGYRQRAVRLEHGIGSGAGQNAALKSCTGDRVDPACKSAQALLTTQLLQPMDLDLNAFFCKVATDVKNARVTVFKQRSTAMGGDTTIDELTTRLEDNLHASACATIIDQWRQAHPAAHLSAAAPIGR